MIILVENRPEVGSAFVSGFDREGAAAALFQFDEAVEWFSTVSDADIAAVTGVLLGSGGPCSTILKAIKQRTTLPVIALSERRSLAETLDLFGAGVDDVVAKPVHAKELLVRLRVVAAREAPCQSRLGTNDISVFLDGRDPDVAGHPLAMPRRERRILDCLAGSRGAWLTKAQIFSQVYGLFNDGIDENVIESHISRLRKRLRERLGREAIESQRFLGYRLIIVANDVCTTSAHSRTSSEQATDVIGCAMNESQEISNEHLWHHGYERVGYGRAS